jgi:hypothetical protein
MNWQQRLRDMLVAGGALSAAACAARVDNDDGSAFAGESDGGVDAPRDRANADASVDRVDAPADAPAETPPPRDGAFLHNHNFCCNANADPCCYIGFCENDASAYAVCEQERKSACESEGGAFELGPSGGYCSSLPAASPDAGGLGPDADGHD